MTAESNAHFDSAIFADLFEAEIRIAASPLRDCIEELTASERELVRGVVHKRELEFATGRMLAKQVLTELSHPEFELLRDQDRVPIWPRDVVGSISHTTGQAEGLCIVAVASSLDRTGLGVDVEPDLPVQEGLQDTICRPSEREWVRAAGTAESGRRCRVVFSVKEAVYKAFYPRIREFWAFKDVEVCLDLAHDSFQAQLPESADRSEVEGRIIRREGWIIAGADYA